MTPKELNKSMTILLDGLLAASGFSKKRIGRLIRKENGCQQFFVFYFTRMGPSDCYALTGNLLFSFPEADKLTSQFLGIEYDALMPTGTKPLYAVVPGQPVLKYRYFSNESLARFAELTAKDFGLYALPFYEQFNTLDKLEDHFDRVLREGIPMGFSVQTGSLGCCIAAVLCMLEKWDKLQMFLDGTDLLSDEHRERIRSHYLTRGISENLLQSGHT